MATVYAERTPGTAAARAASESGNLAGLYSCVDMSVPETERSKGKASAIHACAEVFSDARKEWLATIIDRAPPSATVVSAVRAGNFATFSAASVPSTRRILLSSGRAIFEPQIVSWGRTSATPTK